MPYMVGELDQRVQFKSIITTKDSGGGSSKTFVDNFSCWAKVKSKSGNELNQTDQIQATGKYQFVIRWRNDFDETNQIVWDGEVYNISFISNMGGRKLYLVVDAERGVAQ